MSTRTKHSSEPRASTGVAGLDDVLIGGFPRDHLYLIEGDPGTGKTTLALQFLLEGRERGESGLYVTLSESKNELLQIAASHGWNLEGIAVFEMTPTEAELSPEAQYTVFHPSDVELSDTTNSILKQSTKQIQAALYSTLFQSYACWPAMLCATAARFSL